LNAGVSTPQAAPLIDAVVFDLDGVLLDSEPAWASVREQLVHELGGRWHARAHVEMMGMSSTEWSRYMHDELAVPLEPSEISRVVVERLGERYRDELPLLPHAREAVQRLARRWPLAVASSSNRPLIDLVLELSGLAAQFAATVSSEEVDRGKPAPDVFCEAARRLAVPPDRCAAIEDSGNGILAARAARMRVIAIPRGDFPPEPSALAQADLVLGSLAELGVEEIEP
jgi:HAD superfamily hydrolase (TIGR01509 family)